MTELRSRLHRGILWVSRLALALGVLLAALAPGCSRKSAQAQPVVCYVGGTMRPPMEELVKRYEQQTGRHIQLEFADSGALYIRIKTEQSGDLYVAHDPFPLAAMKEGIGKQSWTMALLTPAIVVPKGNPKGIHDLPDLAQPGLRLGVTVTDYSTLGHIWPLMFDKAGQRQAIEKNIATQLREGGAVANGVMVGEMDAGIVWNAVGWLRREKLDTIPISPRYLPVPDVDAVTTATYGKIDMSRVQVSIVLLNCSKQADEARQFAQFAASPEGQAVFQGMGFTPVTPASGPAGSAPAASAPATSVPAQ